ncbi:MAG: hypothetical protein OHK0039_19570 [Bacteroidia bacterium]
MNKLLLLCLLLATRPAAAQVWTRLSTGAEVGWWVYDLGLTDTLPAAHRGYDRTRLSLVWPLSLAGGYWRGQWYLGGEVAFRLLDDYLMVGGDNRRGAQNRYRIAAPGRDRIPIWQAGVELVWEGIQTPRVALGPALSLGTFWPIHAHPRRETFRWHLTQVYGIRCRVPLRQGFHLTICPTYTDLLITTRSPYRREKHNIYDVGCSLGLLWQR